MSESGEKEKRITIPFFEGLNSLVGHNIAKKTELYHAENARSKEIGVLEKREGQVVLGTTVTDTTFITTANSALFPFSSSAGQGLYRISETAPNVSTIYYLASGDKWTALTGYGAGIVSGTFDHTYAEDCCFLANYNDTNKYIKADGITVVDSTDGTGHLFNSPKASNINFYKNRLYLADFYSEGERYKTTILRSSFPMGIIALVNEDYDSDSPNTLKVTDNKYFYTDTGANIYDIYRGGTKITTITVTTINETDVTVTGTITELLSSDEIWISGTYNGEKKIRWINNPSTTGQDVKRYDSFKMSGGENDPTTMMTNIGNVMMISNKSTMASWNDYTLENFDLDIGNVSKKGYVKILGTLYFMHYTGVYATSGGIPRLMSNKIEKYITGATKAGLEACAAGKKGKSIFFTIGDVTLYNSDGSTQKTLSDVCLEYNLTQENWFVHTNVRATEFATFVETSDVNKLELIDNEGNKAVKEFLSGETDNGTEINFRIDTIKLTPMPTTFDYYIKPMTLLIETDRGSALQAYVNLDKKEEFYPLEGKITKGLSVLKINNKDSERGKPPVCRLISISLRDSSKQLCKISRMALSFLPTTEREDNN